MGSGSVRMFGRCTLSSEGASTRAVEGLLLVVVVALLLREVVRDARSLNHYFCSIARGWVEGCVPALSLQEATGQDT